MASVGMRRRSIREASAVRCRCHSGGATLLPADGVPVKVLSERLGDANATITHRLPARPPPHGTRGRSPLRGPAGRLARDL